MKYIYRFTPGIIVIIYLVFFAAFKSPERPWDRIINSDGKGYYAYLPALFIYHDLQFKFVEQYEYQYYPHNKSVFKEFRQDSGTRTVNKYFPGMAILWLPFFLFGHLMAWLEIFPRDGYSLPYQYAIALSAFIFLYLGARWLMKLLREFGAGLSMAAGITLTITLGTNLLFYVIVEPSMTHVYSFALINGFLLTTYRMFHAFQPKWFVRSLLLFTLIVLVRPTNVMIALLIPFLAGDFVRMKTTGISLFADKKLLARALLQMIPLLLVPVVLWYLQTGKPLVYTYGDEKLNLFHPNVLSILFSFNRGWFVYTPVAFVAMFGLIGWFRKDRFRFYWLLTFLLIFIYVTSCWWVWYYASKCGQRVFVDILGVTGLMLLKLPDLMAKKAFRKGLQGLLVILVILNFVQFYQHVRWIFPPYNITGEIYCDALTSFTRKALVYIPEPAISGIKSMKNDMEKDYGTEWMNPLTLQDTIAFQGRSSSKVSKKIPYSMGAETVTDSLFTTTNRLIRIHAWVFTPRITPVATLVVDFQDKNRSLSYNQFILEEFVSAGQWTPVSFAIHVPERLPVPGKVKVYFYNPSLIYDFYVDDLTVDFISLHDSPEFRKLEGVRMPEALR